MIMSPHILALRLPQALTSGHFRTLFTVIKWFAEGLKADYSDCNTTKPNNR